jgi:hypothetical protein
MKTKKSPLQMVGIKQLSKAVENIPAPTPGYTDEEANKEFDRMKYITDAAIRKGAGAVITVPKPTEKPPSPTSRLGDDALSEEDLNRKKIKLEKIKNQMDSEHEDYRPGAQKKLAEKLHKTKYQVDTGQRGRPTSLRNQRWLDGTSRKSALNMLGISSPLNQGDPTGMQDPSLLQENTTGSGTPWSQYTDEDVAANKGSGKPLATQYFQGTRVNPNTNDAWQTKEQAQETEDLENSDN